MRGGAVPRMNEPHTSRNVIKVLTPQGPTLGASGVGTGALLLLLLMMMTIIIN